MSDDLVKRLRKQSSSGRANHLSKADRLAAADRIEELHNEWRMNADGWSNALVRIEELEAKLAKAVETLKRYGGVMPIAFTPIQDGGYKARTALAELTGAQKDGN